MKVEKRVPLNTAQLGDRAISKRMIYLGQYQLLLFDMSDCEGNKATIRSLDKYQHQNDERFGEENRRKSDESACQYS